MRWLIFITMLAGLFIAFNLSIKDIFKELLKIRWSRVVKARELQKEQIINNDKLNFFQSYMHEIENILDFAKIKIQVETVFQLSFILMALGVIAGLYLSNLALAVVLGIGLFFIPYQWMRYLQYRYIKALNESINLGLSLITNTYIQIEDLVSSIKQNVIRVEEPLKQVLLEFITNVEMINPDIKKAIYGMRAKIKNKFFYRWCDILIQCQDDRDFRNILPAIITEMADVRKHQAEFDTKMYSIYKDYLSVLLVTIGSIPLLRGLNITWYNILMNTSVGKIIVAIASAAMFISVNYVLKMSKPISIS